ncbi:MAG: glycerol kinase GlpK [Thermoplasmatota archaeon]
MPEYVGAIDQGTTGTRFAVFDHAGHLVSSAYEEHTQIFPRAGWMEHNPVEIWQKTRKVMREALRRKRIDPSQLAAIGVTNQRETTIIWDRRTGKPIHNAIVWQCRRTSELCERYAREGWEETIRDRTGLVLDPYFSGTKVKWILDNVSGARERAERGEILFGNVDTWLIWKLTGNHITDHTNASRTLLFDISRCQWDRELLELMDIPEGILPEVRPSVDYQGYGETIAPDMDGFRVPVCGDLGDQQAALFGQTCFGPGEAKNTYGTGSFMLLNTGEDRIASEHGLLTTIAYTMGGERAVYALEGSIFITGAAVQWLRDGLGLISEAAETERMASCVSDSDGVYFVPAFVGLGAPYWDPYARGTIVGITRGTGREHLVRATLESICFQTRDVSDTMTRESGIPLHSLRVDGGAVRNDFLCQLQSDILGVQVLRPTLRETTVLGAAYAAGLANGFWESVDELRENWVIDRTFEPSMREEKREYLYRNWRRAVERSLDWVPPEDR